MGEPGTSSPRHHAAAAAAVTAGGGRFLRPVRPTAEALAIRGPSPARRDDDNDPDRCRSGGGAAGERAARGDRRASREAEVGAPWRAEQRGGGDDWAGGGGRASVLREEQPGGRQTLGGARQENGVRRAQPPGEDEGEPRKWKRWEARSPAQEDAGRQEGRRPALSPLERPRGQDTLMEADSPPREGSRSFQRRGTDGSLQEEPAAQARRGWAKSLHEDARRCERRAAVPAAAAAAGIPAFEKSRSQERFFDSDGPLRAEPRKWEKWVEAGGSLREGSRRWERQAIAGGSVREKSRIWERLIEAESPALEKSRSQSRPIEVNGSPREESRTWRGRIAIERFLREEEEEPGTKGLRGSAGHRLGEPRGLERQGASTSLHEDSRRWKRQAAAGVPLVEKSSDDDKRLHLESLLSDEAKGRARQAEAGGPLREGSSGSRRGVEAVLHDEPVTRGQRVLAGHALEEPRGVERRGVSSSLHEDSGRWKRQAAAGFPLVEKSREWERRMDPDGPPGELFRSSRRTGATESFLQEEPTVQGKRGSVISLSEEPRRWEVRAAAAARIPVLEKSRSPEGLFDSDSPLHAGPRRWEKRVEAGGSLREESNRWKRQASPWGSIRDKSRQWETEADSSPEPRKGTDNPMESVGRARVAQPSIRRPSQTTGDQPGSPEKLPRRDLEVLGSPRPGMLPARMRLAMLREKLAAEGMILQDSKMLRRKSSVSTGNGNQSPGTGVPAGQDSPSAKESEEAEAATKIGTGAETKTRIETRTETGTRTRTRTDTETKADTKARIETRPETATKAETKTGTRTGTAIEAQAEFSRGVKMRSGFASEGDRDRGQRSNHGVGVREETAPTTSRTADLCSPTEDVVKQSARRIIGDYLTQPRPIHKPLHANDDGGGPEDAPREAKARPSGESGSGSPATSNEGVHGGGVGAPHGRRAAEADVPGSRASRPTDDRSAAAAHSGRRYRNGETLSPSRGEREGGTLNGSAGRAAAASEGCPGGPGDASDDSVGEGKIGREGKVGGRGSLAPKEESHVEGQGSLYRKVGLRGHGQMVGTEEVGRQEEGAGHEELAYRKGHFKGPALGHLEGPALSNKEGLTFPQEGLREKDLGNVREGLWHVDGGERKEVRDHNMEGSTYQSEDKEGLKKEHLKAESPTSKQEGLSDQGSLKDNERAKANRTEKTWVKSLQADDEGLVVPVRRRLRYEEELIASNDLDYKVKDAGDPEGQVDTKSQDVGTKEDLSDEEAEDKDSSRYKACLVHVHVQPKCNREDELRGRDQVHTGDGLSKGELVIDRRDPEIMQRDVSRVGGSDSEKEDQAIGGDDESRRGYGLMGEEGEEEEQRPSYEREDDAHKRDGAGDSSSLTGDAQGMGDDYKQRASTMEDQMAKEGFTGGEDVGLSHKNTWAHAMDKKSLANKTRSLDDGHTFKASVYNEQIENEYLTGGDDLGLRFNKVWVSDGENRGLTRNAQSLDDGHTFKVSVYNEQRENEDLTGGDDLGLRFNKVWVSDGENRGLTRKAQSLDDGHTFKASVYNEQRENEDLTGGDDLGLRFNKVWVSDGEDRGLTGKAPSLDDGHTFQASTKEHQRENEGLTGGDDLRLGHKTAWAHDMDTNSRADHAHSADSDLKHQVSPKKNKMEEEGSTDGDDLGLSHKNAWAHGLDTNSLIGNAPSPDDGHTFKASMYEDHREKEGLTGRDDLGLGHKGAWVPAIDTDSPADSAHSPDSDYKHQASTKENQTEKEGSIDGDDLGLSHNKVWTHDPENRGLTGKAQSLYDGYTFQESTRDDLRDREGFTDPRNVGPRHESDWARGTPQPREDDGERLREEGSEPFIGEGPSDGNGGFEPKRGADRGEVKVDNNGTSNDGPGNGTSNSILRRSFGHSSSAEEEPAFRDEDGFGIDGGGGGDDWEDVTARTPWRHPHGGDDENAKPENVHNGGSGYEAPGENSDGEGRDDDDQKSDAGHSAAGPASANAGSIPVFRRPRLADDDRTALENLDDGRPLPDGNKSRDSDSANYRIGSRENDFIGSGECHGRAEPLNENAARLNGGTAALNGTGLDNLPQILDPLKDVDGTVVADEGRGGIGASGRANGADAPGAAPGHGDAASRGDSGSTSGASSQQWVDYFVDSGSPDHDDVHGTYAHVPIGGPAGGGRAAPRDDGTNPFLFVHDAVAQEVDADGRAGRGIWSALFAGGKPCAGRFFEGPDDDLENLPDWLRSIGPSPNPLPLPRSSRDRPPHQKHWQLYKFLPPIKEEVEIRTRPPPIVITPPAAITLTAATAAQKTPDMIPPALASNAAGSPLLPRTPTFDKYKPHENFSAIVSNSKQSYLDMISKIKTRPSRFAKDGVYFQSKDGFGKLPMTKRKNYGYSFSRSMDSAEDLEEKSPAEEQVARED